MRLVINSPIDPSLIPSYQPSFFLQLTRLRPQSPTPYRDEATRLEENIPDRRDASALDVITPA